MWGEGVACSVSSLEISIKVFLIKIILYRLNPIFLQKIIHIYRFQSIFPREIKYNCSHISFYQLVLQDFLVQELVFVKLIKIVGYSWYFFNSSTTSQWQLEIHIFWRLLKHLPLKNLNRLYPANSCWKIFCNP